jgi:acyl-CoA dehydrogenase
MLTLGGGLKRKELISARLGDVLSCLYLASMTLKHYRDQGEPPEDLPLVEWSCRTLLYKAQEALHSLLRNFPNRWVAAALRVAIFPRGRSFSAPSDELALEIAELIMRPSPTRKRLADFAYVTPDPSNPLAQLQRAMETAEEVKPLERKIFDARRDGTIESEDTLGQIDEAEAKDILTPDEAQRVREFDALVMAVTGVDDFDPAELARRPTGP